MFTGNCKIYWIAEFQVDASLKPKSTSLLLLLLSNFSYVCVERIDKTNDFKQTFALFIDGVILVWCFRHLAAKSKVKVTKCEQFCSGFDIWTHKLAVYMFRGGGGHLPQTLNFIVLQIRSNVCVCGVQFKLIAKLDIFHESKSIELETWFTLCIIKTVKVSLHRTEPKLSNTSKLERSANGQRDATKVSNVHASNCLCTPFPTGRAHLSSKAVERRHRLQCHGTSVYKVGGATTVGCNIPRSKNTRIAFRRLCFM